jgi:hypothetical protein
MLKSKLPAVEVLKKLREEHSLQEIADMFGTSRQAVHAKLQTIPYNQLDDDYKTLIAQFGKMGKVLKQVLDFHQTPGDPAYKIASNAFPELFPPNDGKLTFKDGE